MTAKKYIELSLWALAVIVSVFISNSVLVGETARETITDFSGGWDTRTNRNTAGRQTFSEFRNWDMGEELGSIVRRSSIGPVTDSFPRNVAVNDSIGRGGQIAFAHGPSNPNREWIFNVRLSIYHTVGHLPIDSPYVDPDNFWVGNKLYNHTRAESSNVITRSWTPYSLNDTTNVTFLIDSTGMDDWVLTDSVSFRADSTFIATSTDSGDVTGIFAFNSIFGGKQLLTVTPGFGANDDWSDVRVSIPSQYEQTVFLETDIFKGETPHWIQHNERVYMANSRQPPKVYDRFNMRNLFPLAPGRLDILPIPHATGELAGDYLWALAEGVAEDSTLYSRIGYVTPIIRLNNERAKLKNFPRPAADLFSDMVTDTPNADTGASVLYFVLRSKNLFPPRPNDTMYIIDTIAISGEPWDIFDTLTFIDSIPDDSLGKGSYPLFDTIFGVLPLDTAYIDTAILDLAENVFKVDSLYSAPGQPIFLSYTIGTFEGASNTWADSTLGGKQAQDTFLVGVAYMTTLLDTITGVESDSSPALFISLLKSSLNSGKDSVASITVALPRHRLKDSALVLRLWRAQISLMSIPESTYIVGIDTMPLLHFPSYDINGNPISDNILGPHNHTAITPRHPFYIRKPRVMLFVLAYELPIATDSIEDTLTWPQLFHRGATEKTSDPLVTNNIWEPSYVFGAIDGLSLFGDELVMWQGNVIQRSPVDSPGVFNFFVNEVNIATDDGDEVVAVVQVGTSLIVYKKKQRIIYFDLDNGSFDRTAIDRGLGCVASHSIQSLNGVIYYLSYRGVVAERLAANIREGRVESGVISTPINNVLLGDRTAHALADMRSGIIDDNIVFCFPNTDTLFVYNTTAGSWGWWDWSFNQMTHYDTIAATGLIPSEEVVFARNGDERIFKFPFISSFIDVGKATVNDSIAILSVLETQRLFNDDREWQITQVGVNAYTGTLWDTVGGLFIGQNYISIKDENGIAVGDSIKYDDETMQYKLKGVSPNKSRWFTVGFRTGLTSIDSLTLRALDIYARPMGRSLR